MNERQGDKTLQHYHQRTVINKLNIKKHTNKRRVVKRCSLDDTWEK